MGTISIGIDAIKPGMRLAKPLLDSGGATLLPAGIRLTPIFASRIRKWGITAIEVESRETRAALSPSGRSIASIPAAAPAPELEKNPLAEQIAREVESRFVNVADDALMMRLRDIAIRRLVAAGRKGVFAFVHGQTGDSADRPCP